MSSSTLEAEFLYSQLGDDIDLAELVEIFVGEMPNRVAALVAAKQDANWEELTRVAHQLKGAAGSYGFDQVTPYAARLEDESRQQQSPEDLQEAYDDLVSVCGKIRAGTP